MVPTLRIATANAASGRDRRTGELALAGWAAAAGRLDLDVLAVQEVDHLLDRSGGASQTAEIAAAMSAGGPAWTARFAAAAHGSPGDRRTFRSAPYTDLDEPSYGIALMSRHPMVDWRELRLSPSRMRLPVLLPPSAGARVLWVPDEQRVALAARVVAPGWEVTAVCTHLSFAPTRSIGQLREIVAWAAGLPRPLVLLGDLNLPGRLPGRVTGWAPTARARTFPADAPRLQLDHALIDDPAGRVRVVEATTRVLAGSDHRALTVAIAPH